MEDVAQTGRAPNVAPEVKGSRPFFIPRWGYSSVVEQRTVNPFVVSSILSIPAMNPARVAGISAKVIDGIPLQKKTRKCTLAG